MGMVISAKQLRAWDWAIGGRTEQHTQAWRCVGCDAMGVVEFIPPAGDPQLSAKELAIECACDHCSKNPVCEGHTRSMKVVPLIPAAIEDEDQDLIWLTEVARVAISQSNAVCQ